MSNARSRSGKIAAATLAASLAFAPALASADGLLDTIQGEAEKKAGEAAGSSLGASVGGSTGASVGGQLGGAAVSSGLVSVDDIAKALPYAQQLLGKVQGGGSLTGAETSWLTSASESGNSQLSSVAGQVLKLAGS